MPSVARSVRLSGELISDLQKVARKSRCTESEVIQKALRKYCSDALGPHKETLYV